MAAGVGAVELIKDLLDAGARSDARNALGNTPMMLAARDGWADAVKALLAAGADPSLRNKKRERAVDIALSAGHTEIFELLR